MRPIPMSRLRPLLLALAISAGVGATAGASPAAAEPAVCGVRIVRAPAALRAELEPAFAARGLGADGACAALDVWLAPAEGGGIAIRAIDPWGRPRERVVADAATALALLASWADPAPAAPLWGAEPPAAAVVDAVAPVAPAVAPAPPPPSPPAWVAPAAVAPPGEAAVDVAATPSTVPAPRRGMSVGVAGQMTSTEREALGGGVRVQVDLLERWRFLIGAAAIARGDGTPAISSSSLYGPARDFERDSLHGLVTVRRPLGSGRTQLVPGVAIGYGVNRHVIQMYSAGNSWLDYASSTGVMIEASLAIQHRLGTRWSAEAGLVADNVTFGSEYYVPVSEESHVGGFVGLRRGL